jgi:hypothetical protein
MRARNGGRPVALGFSPHSGWAAVVAIGAAESGLFLAARGRIEMADPGEPQSRQPYHAVERLAVSDAAERLARYQEQAARMASGQLRELVDRLVAEGRQVVGCGLLESSGRKGAALASILASHALIHTADGDHFRNAIARSAESLGLGTLRVPVRTIDAAAASAVGRPATAVRREVERLGREVGPPWAADQKAAALVAWVVLAKWGERTARQRG